MQWDQLNLSQELVLSKRLKIKLRYLALIKCYNRSMGGVDKVDALVAKGACKNM